MTGVIAAATVAHVPTMGRAEITPDFQQTLVAGERTLGAAIRRALKPGALKGARIGVAREKFFGYSEVTDRLAEDALEVLRREGAVLVDPANVPNAGTYDAAELEVGHPRMTSRTSSRFCSMSSSDRASRLRRSSGSVFEGRTLKCQSSNATETPSSQ